ncbi:uncharacterized protein LOC115750153 [Rhodamnia argentea]|uniref:Uncharacterized protein LOC115750153 n=1 Tax=Rhodamnia argentea TaxID=178133 RepID=A0A8B8QAB5_9MYRT|nr:uncharacterized protein LOC115750153 [Rhodamnia argentea]
MESREGRETRDRKRTAHLRVGGSDGGDGGGVRIEGVLVWGGTLAIASLMALFTIRVKKRDSSRCPCGPGKLKIKATEEGGGGEGDENGGLLVVLQDQSSPTGPLTPRNSSCCIGGSYGGSSTTDLAHLDCCDSASGQSLTSEEKPAAFETDEEKEPHQETVFSEGAKTESVASFSDYSVVEDGSPPPAMQDPALATDDWNEETENHLKKQIIHASSEVDEFDHVADEALKAEVVESADSVEEEEEEEGSGDDEQAEEVEGSSEESGDSSPELNADAIWTWEMIDEAVKTITEDRADVTKINKQENDSIIHEEGEEDEVGDDTSENPADLTALHENGLGLEEPVAGNHWTTRFLRPPIWIWYVLLLLILLSFLVHSSSIRSFAMNRRDLAIK